MEIVDLTHQELDEVNGGFFHIVGAVLAIAGAAIVGEFAIGFVDGLIDGFTD